jgi:hypothetical protein
MKKIGTITLGECAILSDPGYEISASPLSIISTIEGEYNVYITRSKSKHKGLRNCISNIIAIHKDYVKVMNGRLPMDDSEDLNCGVDSGTCGIFDAGYYEEYHFEGKIDDDWFDRMVVQDCPEFLITDGQGAFSSSGNCDGWFPVFAEYKGTKAYAIRIKFL